MSDFVHAVSDATFEHDVLSSDIPVLVDFWAPWCGPCKMIAPLLEEVAQAYEGRIKIVKVDVDESGSTASKYNVRSIPTLIIFNKGDVVNSRVAALGKSDLVQFIEDNI